MDRRTFFAGAALLPTVALTGCATRSSIDDGASVKPSQGLLAFKISSGVYAKLNYVKYEPSRSLSGFLGEMLVAPPGSFAVDKGDTYFVHPIEAGEYMWGQLTIGMGAVADLHGSNRFVVKPGAITYIGHLSLNLVERQVDMRSSDQEQDMRAHLTAKFPKYTATMPLEKAIARFHLAR